MDEKALDMMSGIDASITDRLGQSTVKLAHETLMVRFVILEGSVLVLTIGTPDRHAVGKFVQRGCVASPSSGNLELNLARR